MQDSNTSRYSLASLFLATAILAVFLAACTVAVRNNDMEHPAAVGSVVLAALVGTFVGGAMGIGRERWIRGCLAGMFAGNICGSASGLLLCSPGVWPTLVIGSAVVVLFGAVVRRLSGKPSEG